MKVNLLRLEFAETLLSQGDPWQCWLRDSGKGRFSKLCLKVFLMWFEPPVFCFGMVLVFQFLWPRNSRTLVLNLGLLRSFGLQLPEAFTTSCPDWGFWELQFKSIRVTKVKNHCSRMCGTAPPGQYISTVWKHPRQLYAKASCRNVALRGTLQVKH